MDNRKKVKKIRREQKTIKQLQQFLAEQTEFYQHQWENWMSQKNEELHQMKWETAKQMKDPLSAMNCDLSLMKDFSSELSGFLNSLGLFLNEYHRERKGIFFRGRSGEIVQDKAHELKNCIDELQWIVDQTQHNAQRLAFIVNNLQQEVKKSKGAHHESFTEPKVC